MRAFRRGIGLLALLIVLCGCSSPTKQRYLRHLSVTLAPDRPDVEPVTNQPAIAAAANRPAP